MDMERTDLPKILVIHQGALGDVVLSFPALSALRQEKGAALALLCNNQVGKIAQELGVADAHFSVESARFCRLFSDDLGREIKDFINQYDTVFYIGFSKDLESHIKQNHSGQTFRVPPRPPAGHETHVAAHMMTQMQARGLSKSTPDLGLSSLTTSSIFFQKKNLPPDQKNLVIIHPGAGSQRKRWPLENFIEVAYAMREMDSAKVVFLIGPSELDVFYHIKSRAQGQFEVRGVEDLSTVLSLTKACKCFIGNDSGLAHLAAFVGLPTVAIFGPSNPKRWAPVGRATKVLRGETDCSPCFEVAKTNCETPQCLEGVSVEMVLEAVRDLQYPQPK
jgi:heptosyltransferase-3